MNNETEPLVHEESNDDDDKEKPSSSVILSHNEEQIDITCCDPRKGYYRFIGLFFMCFLSFGSYFCYDTPGSLQDQIKKDMHVNTAQFASLYSFYSWPNVVLSFVGGFLIDRVFGVQFGTTLFSSICFVGQIIYAFGAILNLYWVMQAGRFFFGIGGESLAVAQNAYTVAWFKGKELNTVFGLLLSMSRIGSTVNFLIMGPVYSWVSTFEKGHMALGISLMFAAGTCILSLFCAVILQFLDKRRVRVLRVATVDACDKIQLRDILKFPLSFWLICIICVSYYVAIFPFIGLSKVFFMRKYNYDESYANLIASLVYSISCVAAPFCGFFVDKMGRNIFFVFLAVLVSLCCHAMLAFTFFSPIVVMIVLGFGYSLLASSLWPMVAMIIPEHQLGTAYGIIQSIQNLGLALISMLGGFIVDESGYFILEMFYLLWLCAALGSSIAIWTTDASSGGSLNLSIEGRKAKKQILENKVTGDDQSSLLSP